MIVFSSILLQLIVFFLPTQLGLHFWPDFSRAAGIKIDYLSPTLYFTDILIILFLIGSLPKIFRWLTLHLSPVAVFLIFISLNSFFAVSPFNTLFWWGRLLLYLLLFLVLRLTKVTWSQIRQPLLFSTILIVSLEFLQYISQSSIGGPFYWLGERFYSVSSSGMGRLSLFGLDFVRPPSTFSHPNSLASYLLVVAYLYHLHPTPRWQRSLVLAGLVLTVSKAALLAYLLVMIFSISSAFLIWSFLILALLQVTLPYLPSTFQFVSDRLFLLIPAKKILLTSPILGVGIGSFIPALASYLPGSFLIHEKLQPVHNTPLLFLTETGFAGMTLIYLLISKNRKKLLKPAILGLLALVMITGAFDHYWWTLPQNKLILLLAMALML